MRIILLSFCLVFLLACKGNTIRNLSESENNSSERHDAYTGDVNYFISTYGNKDVFDKRVHFVALHENETTCIAAFNRLPDKDKYKLIRIRQNGKRLLHGSENGSTYYFDPNRIFSAIGIENTLRAYNKNISEKMGATVLDCANSILTTILREKKSTYIIALHNNTDGSPLSIGSYQNSADAADLFISEKEDPDNFFLTTKTEDFNYFKRHNRNVVLQSQNATDDGSLSVFFQKKNIPYINIEAQFGALDEQKKMIELCLSLIQSKQ